MELASQRSSKLGQPLKPRHVPLRTCIGCRSTLSKRELIRVVRSSDGVVQFDPTGKQAGRGAYLHTDPDCFKESMRKGRLAHALRATVSSTDQTALEEQLRQVVAQRGQTTL